MATEQEKLIAKGAKEPSAGMVQQAEYSIGLFDLYKKDLADHGYPETKGAAMREQLTLVKDGLGSQTQTWSEAYAKTRAEVIAVDNTKAFATKLWKALPLVLREGKVDLEESDFAGANQAERSTPKLITWLDRIRMNLSKIDAELKPFFKGESPVSIAESLRATLVAADQTQELARVKAPDATTKLNEAKGRLLQLIEDMNRVAAIAFYGRADVIGRFNKDILLRARRSKSGKAEPAPTPSPTPTPE